MPDMRQTGTLLQALLITALLIGLSGCEQKKLQALGTLEWDRVNGRAVASEPILEILARQGDLVSSGQPLLRLDGTLQQQRVTRLRASVQRAQWELRELENGFRSEQVAAAKAQLRAARQDRITREKEHQRQQKLLPSNLTSQQRADEVERAFKSAIAAEQVAQEQLSELQSGFRSEQLEQARAQLAAEQAELAYQQALLERYTIFAERAGRLDSLPFRTGDKPPAGAVLTTVLAGDSPWARVYLPEPWLSRLQVGSQVKVLVDGLEPPMAGRIRFISAQASFTPYFALSESNRSRLSFVTEVDILDDRALQLPLGIPVQVEPADD